MKSPAEAMELWTSHTRKQFETFTAQAKELAELGQKVATETVEPIKASASKYSSRPPDRSAFSFKKSPGVRPGLFLPRDVTGICRRQGVGMNFFAGRRHASGLAKAGRCT